MPSYRYLIVGGGMAADAAVRGIRELDQTGSIGVIGREPDPPYARPPLSKALWKGEPFESIWRNTVEAGAELCLGRRAVAIDPAAKTVVDEKGESYRYEKLLLATGGVPRRLSFGTDRVVYYRTVADFRGLHALARQGRTFAVIGGGFIGAELAAALALQGCRVTMLFPSQGIGARIFPGDLAEFLVGYYREKGVDTRPGENVTTVVDHDAGVIVETTTGLKLAVDVVVAGLGIEPETTLARDAGLAIDDGVVVDRQLRTSSPDIFAAGDVARFEAPGGLGQIRVEHEDNAVTMGRAAGRAMAGDATPYAHQPFFYSDLFDLGYEAVGRTDSRLETVSDWKVPFQEGVVYYLEAGRVRGVLLWNTWGQVDAARALIAEPGPFEAGDLIGRLPVG